MFTERRVVTVLTAFVFALASQLGVEAQGGQQTPPPREPEFGSEDVMTAAPEMPPFDARYFVGEWEIEWLPPDLDLFPGGKYTGVERVEQVANRHLKVEVELHAEGGQTIKGQGIILVDQGLSGLQLLKYVAFDRGFALFQAGPIAVDLLAGSSYKHTWEVPEFTFNGTKYALKGNSNLLSPAAYRVNQQVSMDGGSLMNLGILWYTKRTPEEAPAAPAR